MRNDSTAKRSALSGAVIAIFVLATFLSACQNERTRDEGYSLHPTGFASEGSADFHGDHLRTMGYPLADCRSCHGDDYGGGAVGVSCESSGCHDSGDGVQDCGTCHGSVAAGPAPSTGSHGAHQQDCQGCHPFPDSLEASGHLNGTVELVFTGLAIGGGSNPTWSAGDSTCSGTYCHGAGSPTWGGAAPGCGDCHGAPPSPSHDRFARVATVSTCVDCHPDPSSATHPDGVVQIGEPSCGACHGSSSDGAPPLALDGASAATDRAVGAHARHLDSSLLGRVSAAVDCQQCHRVPASLFAAGHLDSSAPADVRLVGSYDATTQTCTAWCHGDAQPVWTDDSGSERQCDSCHGFPPAFPHPSGGPTLDCSPCHDYSLTTHIDGEVTLR